MTPKKQKRKIKPKAVLILSVLVVVIAAALGSGIKWLLDEHDKKVQTQLQEQVSEKINTLQTQISSIEQASFDTEASQEETDALNSLKQQAEAPLKTDLAALQALQSQHISQAQIDEINTEDENARKLEGLLTNLSGYDPYLIDFLNRDNDRLDFVVDWKEKSAAPAAASQLSQSLESVPLVIQWSEDFGYMPYGSNQLYRTGCGPTCLSMVLSYLKQDPTITPWAVAQFSEENGYWVDGAGSSWELMNAAAEHYGVSVSGLEADPDQIMNHLQAGHPIIVSVVPGDFTRTGHFIVLTGIEDGKIKVNDPNSLKNSEKRWDLDTILGQTASLWVYGA